MDEGEEVFFNSRKDPNFFFRDILKLPTFEWDGKMRTHTPEIESIAISVRDNENTYVKSGNGCGKTHGCAGIDLWFLFCHPGSFVLITAPTERQVREILFSEISRQYKNYLGGSVTYLKIDINDNWKLIGFTARESTDHEKMAARMQGFHAPSMLVHFDEAPGVHSAFWKAKDRVLTGTHVRFLAVGNPTSPTGDFYEGCIRHNAITISCLTHPNVISGKEIIPGAVTRKWVEDRKAEWGDDSPMYISCVLGEFPDEGEDTLIPLSHARRAADREKFLEKGKVKSLGVDVARFGNDRTSLKGMEGRNEIYSESYHGKDLNWTLARIKEVDEKEQFDVIVIDDTGVGGGVTDGLKGWTRKSDGKSPLIVALNFGAAPEGFFDNIEFQNLKAEIFWLLKFDFAKNNITILNDGKTISDVCSLKYDYTPKQQIKIIGKEEMRKKGLPSPDDADALAMANYGTKLRGKTAKLNSEKTPTVAGNIIDKKF